MLETFVRPVPRPVASVIAAGRSKSSSDLPKYLLLDLTAPFH